LFTFEALKQRVPLIIEIVNSNIQALKDDSKFIEKNGLYSFTEKISGVGMINIIIGSGGSHIFWLKFQEHHHKRSADNQGVDNTCQRNPVILT
jgi:hypothetical protein